MKTPDFLNRARAAYDALVETGQVTAGTDLYDQLNQWLGQEYPGYSTRDWIPGVPYLQGDLGTYRIWRETDLSADGWHLEQVPVSEWQQIKWAEDHLPARQGRW